MRDGYRRDSERRRGAARSASGWIAVVIGAIAVAAGVLAIALPAVGMPTVSAPPARQDGVFGVATSDPPAGASLDARPGEVSVTFTDPVVPFDSAISVFAPDGTRIDAGAASYSGDGRTVIALVDPLGDARGQSGTFRVAWQVVRARTGATVTGTFTFTAAASAGVADGSGGAGTARLVLALGAGAAAVGAAVATLLRSRGRRLPLTVAVVLVVAALGAAAGAVAVGDGTGDGTAERVDADWPVVAAGSGNTVSYRVGADGAVELLFRDRRGEPRALDLVQVVARPDDPGAPGIEVEPETVAVHRYRIAAGTLPAGRMTLDVLASGLGVMDSVRIPVSVP